MPETLDFRPVDRCLLCDSTSFHPVKGVAWRGVAFSYALCGQCGLKFMTPRPTPETFERFFREEYWQMNMAASGYPSVAGYNDANVDQMAFRMPKYQRAYEVVRSRLLKTMTPTPQTRFLEVGCAFGYTLEWLKRDYGCQVFGVEPSTEAVERCGQGGVPVVGTTAEAYFCGDQPAPGEEPYDVILFRHCLETLLDPKSVLQGVRRRLKPAGVLLIFTANVEYYDAMSPYAPFIYSPETVSRLVRICGFEVASLTAPPSPRDHRTAVRVVRPSHEIALTAHPAEPRSQAAPKVDALAVARTIELGNQSRSWSSLGWSDLIVRLALKTKARLSGR